MSKILKLDILLVAIISGALVLSPAALGLKPQLIPLMQDGENLESRLLTFQQNILVPISNPPGSGPKVVREVKTIATGYSSTFDQTDETPFITASGTQVREGIVAANFLPFGTKIRLPELYGDKIFVVEDRMHPRKKYQVDIWFPNREDALNFGAEITYIEVLEG